MSTKAKKTAYINQHLKINKNGMNYNITNLKPKPHLTPERKGTKNYDQKNHHTK
ncbi:hypothetical protein HYE18_00805 [Mycoplasmopsis bovis]|nr:hypothetical protein [Mycoplasmopsis bovis]QQH24993.1 hypothetical protein HYE18_00805 [Mycoplasmopsis bovis]